MSAHQDLGLYIHIPFCKTICVYCAFSTFANKAAQIDIYIDTLIKEIEAKSHNFPQHAIKTIYFGGGTPSILENNQLQKLLETIPKHFDTASLEAIEIECNPESLTKEKIHAYQKLGITRISVGIQTLHDKSLWKIARPHNAEIALQALGNLNTAGFSNFGCDLIIGLPYQTLRSFQSEVKKILSFNPAHLSTYFLSLDTPKINTFIADSPSEKEQIAMYEWADKYLTQQEFTHYEVSNFARSGYESKHNMRYWNRKEYLGLGLSAHSFTDDQVSENQDSFVKYLTDPLSPKEKFSLSGDLAVSDTIMLSLRQKTGINLKNISQIYGDKIAGRILESSKPYLQTGQLTQYEHRIRPTLKGWLIIDKITRDLL